MIVAAELGRIPVEGIAHSSVAAGDIHQAAEEDIHSVADHNLVLHHIGWIGDLHNFDCFVVDDHQTRPSYHMTNRSPPAVISATTRTSANIQNSSNLGSD